MHSGTSIGMAVRTRETDRVASSDAGMERGEGERPGGGRGRSEEEKKEEEKKEKEEEEKEEEEKVESRFYWPAGRFSLASSSHLLAGWSFLFCWPAGAFYNRLMVFSWPAVIFIARLVVF